jgi:N-acetylglucosaminyldiphosphoundecaprenol N-acetyl-beta-D-mannosaminyltransferase
MTGTGHQRIEVLGVKVDVLTVEQLLARMQNLIEHRQRAIVANVNVHALNLTCEVEWLRGFFNRAEVVFCDGAGVALGARLLRQTSLRRITYADWMWQVAEFAELRRFTFFFLGAAPGVAEKAATRLRQRFPSLQIVGAHHGYFDKTPASPENISVVQAINTLRPDILLVAFGMPLQERWLNENWGRLEATVALTGGAVFDYISGELQRGPHWMTDNGLEWLFRLMVEPRRLWRRYLIGNPLFLWRVLQQRLGLLRFED